MILLLLACHVVMLIKNHSICHQLKKFLTLPEVQVLINKEPIQVMNYFQIVSSSDFVALVHSAISIVVLLKLLFLLCVIY